MNHLLKCSGGMRLFQAGVDRKLIKEATGHKSDAVDAYHITGEHQRQMICHVVKYKPSTISANDKKSNESKEKLVSVEDIESRTSENLKSIHCSSGIRISQTGAFGQHKEREKNDKIRNSDRK